MADTLRQCARCDRLFRSAISRYCPQCTELIEKEFQQVRNYIQDHPQADVTQVSDQTGVSTELLLEFLHDGRLQLNYSTDQLRCAQCGRSILSGRYCESCLNTLRGLFHENISSRQQTGRGADGGEAGRGSSNDRVKWHSSSFRNR